MGLAPHWRRAVIATSLATMVVSAGTVLAPGASAAGCAPTITLRQDAVNASSVTWSVSVVAGTTESGCSGPADFSVTAGGKPVLSGQVAPDQTRNDQNTTAFLCNTLLTATVTQDGVPASNSLTTGYNPPNPPGAPTFVSSTRTSLTAQWSAQLVDACHPVTSYLLYSGSGDGARSVTTNATTATLDSLTAGTSYDVRVTAVNGLGRAESPATRMSTTTAAVPTAVSALQVLGTTSTTITLDWKAPLDDGGSPVTGYRVTWNGGATTVASTGYSLTGLSADTPYSITVAAINGNGTGASAQASARTSKASQAAAAGPPRGLAASNVQDTSVRLTWKAPASDGGSAVSGYRVVVNGKTTNVTGTAVDVTGLSAGTSYSATVAAVNDTGAGTPATVSFRTTGGAVTTATPGSVVNLQITAKNATSATLDWSAPLSTGGSPITSYTVTNITTGQRQSLAAPITQVTLALAPARTYALTVVAVNANGDGLITGIPVTTDPKGAPDKTAQGIQVTLTSGGPWKSGRPHVVGAARSNAGLRVTWTAKGRWVASSKVKTKRGTATMTVALKKGAPKSVTVLISAQAPSTQTRDAAHVTNTVVVRR